MSFTLPTSKLTYYHTFSKLPVEDTLPLGSAINKAGHTVSATEVWTAEIPYFGKMGSTADVTSKVTPYAKTNDMVQITSGADKDKVFRRNEVDKTGKTFNDLWVDVTSEFVDGATFKNANGDEVLIYHKGKKLELLDEGNNANITSKNNASRLWVGEGDNRRLVEQFVGVTDRSLNGLASVAYAPAIKKGNTDQVAGTHYFDYCVSGTILWATANTTDSYITCFEYKGPKVSVSIENLQAAINAVQGTIENGVVSSISPSADAKSAGFDIDDSEPTSPIINFTKGEVAKDSTALVTGGDVWNYITELHSVPQLRIVIVEEPADDWTKTEGLTIEKNTIYLVNDKASDPALSGSYIEYLAYAKKDGTIVTEQIGSTKIDLVEYAKDAEVVKSIATANGVSGSVENNVATITVQDGTTSQKGIVKLDNTIADSTSETTAVTPKAVKEYAQKALTVKDDRETVTENDLWGTTATLDSDGVLTVSHSWVTNHNAAEEKAWNASITKVEDNKAYVDDTMWANIQTERVKDGSHMFRGCSNLNSFSSDLSSLTRGSSMFTGSENLTSFSSGLPSLTNGGWMFSSCSNLTSFTIDLPSLTYAFGMFQDCSNLTTFTSDLSSLASGAQMFYSCSNLTTFTSDLSSLASGGSMFSTCENLTSFISNLSSLISCEYMFKNCSKLETFISDLSSLINGYNMFTGCKLDAESVMYIADTIKDIIAEKQLYIDGVIPYVTVDTTTVPYKFSAPSGFMENGKYAYTFLNASGPLTTSTANVGYLTLGINVVDDTATIEQQLENFAKEAAFDSWDKLKQHFIDRGWTRVSFQYNGGSDSVTYDLRNREQITPCPIFAKLEEVFVPSEEEIKQANEKKENLSSPHYEYTSQDGTRFYNVHWYHESNATNEEYTLFESLDAAIEHFNIIPAE